MTSDISIRDVVKRYRRGSEQIEALHRVNLEIPSGDFLALMGPSGSGKSTLLNLIGGLDRPDDGEVHAGGRRIDTLSQKDLTTWRARNVGFVFQFYNLIPALTAARNIEIPLLLTSLSREARRHRVCAVLAIVGLSGRAEHRPTQLSGGEQQRVAIARALVADPEILVCDEPTGDLDRHAGDEILGLLQLLNERGKTIIMVTHDARAAEHAKRIRHLDKGVLSAEPTKATA